MAIKGFGTPKLKGSFWKNFKIESPKGDETTKAEYALLPPIGEGNEVWKVFHGTHFGYRGRDPGDSTKKKMRTFKCIQRKNKDKMIIEECPECNEIAEKESIRAAREQEYKAKGKSEDEIKTLLAPLDEWLKNHNCDKKWHFHVMNIKTGEFGTLVLSYTSMKVLEAEIERVKLLDPEDPIDPFDLDNGVVFEFRRSGKGRETKDVIVAAQIAEKVNGKLIQTIKRNSIAEKDQEFIIKNAPDLNTVVRALTEDQIQMLVASNNDAEEVDNVFNMASKEVSPGRAASQGVRSSSPRTQNQVVDKSKLTKAANELAEGVDDELPDERTSEADARKAAAAAPKEEPKAEEPAGEIDPDEAAALAAQKAAADALAAIKAKKAKAAADAAAAAPKTEAPPATETAAAPKKDAPASAAPKEVDQMSDDEFMELYGAKKSA